MSQLFLPLKTHGKEQAFNDQAKTRLADPNHYNANPVYYISDPDHYIPDLVHYIPDPVHYIPDPVHIIPDPVHSISNHVQFRAVDPDPHESTFIFPPGSGSRRVKFEGKNRKNARKME